MQWYFNLVYYITDYVFSLVPVFPVFPFLSDFQSMFTTFANIVNYYFPLDDLFVCLTITVNFILGFGLVKITLRK